MSDHTSLSLVIQVSTDRRNVASLGLAGSRRQTEEAKRKFDMLCRYRHDYLARMNDGPDSVRIASARAFIEKLEHAMAHQEREVEACESYATVCFQQLNVEEKKLKSLEMLRDRRLKEAGYCEKRHEQKRSDEFGARAARNGGAALDYRPA